MWRQIAINKRNSCLLIVLMLLVLLLLGAAFGILSCYYVFGDINDIQYAIRSAEYGIFFACVVWFILFIIALCNGKNAILALNHACKLPKHAHLVLENVVEEMSIAAGMPKPPEIYVIDTPMPNAFATGLTPDKSAVAVTTGLLTELNRDELQGVIAHEIAHIVNRDTMYMIFAGIMIGAIVLMSEYGMRMMRGAGRTRRRSAGKGDVILLVVCLVLMILAPILAQILYFSISQKREYLADACAVQFTRYPSGLATALAKINASLFVFRDADKITSAMYIVHPLDYEKQYKNMYSMFGSLFSTHPPTEKRIAVLEKMTGADFNSYNEAFKKVASFGQTILKKEDLYGVKPLAIEKPAAKNDYMKTASAVGTIVGTSALAAAANTKISESKSPENIENSEHKEQIENDIKKERKRAAEDIIWKAKDYIFKECQCGTKFKFPEEYKGQTIKCPHCKHDIEVV